MIGRKKIGSIRFAFTGIKIALREELNFRVEIVWGAATLLLGWFFHISRIEWIVVLFIIGFVLSAEALNTALEELCDKFQPTHDPHIGKIKDLAAAAVLIAAATAFAVGLAIFIPYLISLT